MHDEKIKRLTLAGLMCAVVVITTMFAAVPIPGVQGAYANAGDAAVYASAYLLGWPWGVMVAAVGSGLADLLLGSALYAPATLVIKGLMALIAAKLLKKQEDDERNRRLAEERARKEADAKERAEKLAQKQKELEDAKRELSNVRSSRPSCI